MSHETGITSSGPLTGRRVVVTRARHQADALCHGLERAGAFVELCPAIRITPPEDPTPFRRAIAQLPSYDWLVLTSTNGVAALFDEFARSGASSSVLASLSIGCVGPATAAALQERGVKPDLVPETFTGAALASTLRAAAGEGDRVLLARARDGDRAWPTLLREWGLSVDDVESYRTGPDEEGLARGARVMNTGSVDLVVFTSPSTATLFAQTVGALLSGVALAAIGPVTATRIRELGYEPAIIAEAHTTSGLLEAIGAHFAKHC